MGGGYEVGSTGGCRSARVPDRVGGAHVSEAGSLLGWGQAGGRGQGGTKAGRPGELRLACQGGRELSLPQNSGHVNYK